MKNLEYTKITNRLFFSYIKNKSLIQLIDNPKLILVLDYLYRNTTRENVVKCSLDDIIIKCGYKPKTGKGKINEQIKNILMNLDKFKIISIENTIHKSIITIDVKNLIQTDVSGNDIQFFKLDQHTIDKLKIIDSKNIDTLLLYYSYFRCRIFDTNNCIGVDHKAKGLYNSINMISEETTLSKNTVVKYNKIFSDNKILYIQNIGKKQEIKTNKISECNNLYTIYNEDKELEMKLLKKQYMAHLKNKGYRII